MINFPYGMSDFRQIITEGYFYRDRTGVIPLLERGRTQLFIRPRRFGKSLLLSMLENYYDVARKDAFEELFGRLTIGRNPTSLRNRYFILQLDFSCVDPMGAPEDWNPNFGTCADSGKRKWKRPSMILPPVAA